jgi:glycolate oxidase
MDSGGYDRLGIVVGSEGLLGVVTEVTVRILRKPQTARGALVGFPTVEDGGNCVAQIIAEGIIPGGIEMMDKPAIHAAEAFAKAGYPLDAESLLIVELDGPQAEVDELIANVARIAKENNATSLRISESEEERMRFWAGRKSAFPAVGRISPDYVCMDGLGADILRLCVDVGGVLTGEHGVGVEKRDLMPAMFDETDLAHQQRLKCAFDPEGLLNPGKVFPQLHRCAEMGKMHVQRGALPFPELPRF